MPYFSQRRLQHRLTFDPCPAPPSPCLQTMGAGTTFAPAVHVSHDTPWERRDVLGVHPQKQEGLSWVGASVPSGRLQADDLEVRGVMRLGSCCS